MLDAGRHPALRAQRAPGPPVSRLVVGQSVDTVGALLPRLFSVCRAAQSAAVEAALGRPVSLDRIAEEILRDHLLKFHVTWPRFFGRPPRPLPADWAAGGEELRRAAFGPTLQAPATAAGFFEFLESGEGYSPVLKLLDTCFARGEALAEGIATVTPQTIWSDRPVDNSVVVRVAGNPAMLGIAETRGKGPFWRAAARLFDIAAMLDGQIPPVVVREPGQAIVPAARGCYAVRLVRDGDTVVDFDRVTPTDHLLAPDGVLDRSLATLPAIKSGLGPLLLDILDPCSPVRLQEVVHA